MREDDGRKLDHQTLEALRLRAVEQVARGVPAAQVGAGLAALGLHRCTIYRDFTVAVTDSARSPKSIRPCPRSWPGFSTTTRTRLWIVLY